MRNLIEIIYQTKNMLFQITNYLSNLRYFDTFITTIVLNVSFFATCYWIYCKETSGKWEQYRIKINSKAPSVDLERRKETYKAQIGWVLFYLGVVMPIVFIFPSNYIFTSTSNVIVDLLKTFLSYLITRSWSFFVHIVLHTPFFAKYHKDHHVPMSDLTCVGTFSNSTFEFLMMEAFAWVIGMSAVGGLPVYCAILLGSYNFINGAMDHSGFCLDEFWFNSIYHFVHHAEPTTNYAEFSFLDILYGTYKDYPITEVVEAFKPTPIEVIAPELPTTTTE